MRSHFRTFTLPDLLPSGQALIVNTQSYFFDHFVVSLMSDKVHGLEAQQVFSAQEMYALLALLESWPDYCPYEVLLATLSDTPVEQARRMVHEAMESKHLDSTLNPLRNLFARCRPRLHDFGIDVGSRRGLGYQLQRVEGLTRSYGGQSTNREKVRG